MNIYQQKYAQLYDLFYKDKNYVEEVEFIHRCITGHSTSPAKTVLEFACGTGNHSLHLSKKRYKITATDYSQEMLDCAVAKHKKEGTHVVFERLDMKAPKKFDTPFDVVICLFDSMGYLESNEAILGFLQNVKQNLKKDGLFIVEYWNAGAMLRHFDPVRIKRFKTEQSEIVRISETSLDYQKQMGSVTYTILETIDSKPQAAIKEEHRDRFFLQQEINLFLLHSGLTPVKSFAGFTDDEKITEETWHTVMVAANRT